MSSNFEFHSLLSHPTLLSHTLSYLQLKDLLVFDTSLTNIYYRSIFLISITYHTLPDGLILQDYHLSWIALRKIKIFSIILVNMLLDSSLNLSYLISSLGHLSTLHHISLKAPHGVTFKNHQSSSSPHLLQLSSETSLSSISLDLSQCSPLQDDDMIAIFSSFPRIQSINLNNQTLVTAKSIKLLIKLHKHLTSMHLHAADGIDNSILRSLLHSSSSTLQELDISSCTQVVPRTFIDIAKSCTNICSLNLSSCPQLCDISLHKILQKCQNLIHLNISSTNVSVISFSNLPKSLLPFELIANNCPLMNNACVGIISCIYRKMRVVSLKDSPIEHAALMSLSLCLELEDISLTLSKPTNALPYLICKCHALKSITFGGSSVCTFGSSDNISTTADNEYHLPTLCLRLSQYGHNITQLSFTKVNFTISDFQTLSKSCPQLSSIALHSCVSLNVQDDWKEFLFFLQLSSSLSQLSLSPCDPWPLGALSQIISTRQKKWNSLRFLASESHEIPLSEADIQSLMTCLYLHTLQISHPSSSFSNLLSSLLISHPHLTSLEL